MPLQMKSLPRGWYLPCFVNDEERRRRAKERIRAGLLPGSPPAARWAGPGSGKPCGVCDEPISRGDIEHELDFEDGKRLTARFHRECLDACEAERSGQ